MLASPFNLLSLAIALLFAFAVQTVRADCGWRLEPNDCICMSSTNGTLLADETSVCCRDMGQKTTSSVCNVDDDDKRQTFKDCCKWLKETSLVGHCR